MRIILLMMVLFLAFAKKETKGSENKEVINYGMINYNNGWIDGYYANLSARNNTYNGIITHRKSQRLKDSCDYLNALEIAIK